MTHPSKAKGDRMERIVRDYLISEGLQAERIPAGVSDDTGDIWTPTGHTIQVKDRKVVALPEWWRDTQLQTANNRHDFGWLVHKRHGVTDPAAQWVTCDLAQLARILEGAVR